MKRRSLRRLGPLLGLVLFVMALWFVHTALARYRYRDIVRDLKGTASIRVWIAVGLTVLNYVVLTLYDVLAFRYIGQALAYPKIALGSFLGYVFSLNVGLSALGRAQRDTGCTHHGAFPPWRQPGWWFFAA
jgi:uncharacterized membrane protein YbhN (UPF0104 family)